MWVIYHIDSCKILGQYTTSTKAAEEYILLIRAVLNNQYEDAFDLLSVEQVVDMNIEEWKTWKLLSRKVH